MQTNVAQYLGLAQYLLVPPRAWRIFISLSVVIVLSISAFFELKGTKDVFYKSVVLLLAALRL